MLRLGEEDEVAVGLEPFGLGRAELMALARDQFDHFVWLAYDRGDPGDWRAFRSELCDVLVAAWALDTVRVDLDPVEEARRVDVRIAEAGRLLDLVQQVHDPAQDWSGFREAVWGLRAVLVAGL